MWIANKILDQLEGLKQGGQKSVGDRTRCERNGRVEGNRMLFFSGRAADKIDFGEQLSGFLIQVFRGLKVNKN